MTGFEAQQTGTADAEASAFQSAILARLRQVLGDTEDFIPLHAPEFSGDEWALVKECLDTGWVSSVGKFVDQFEQMLAERCGVAHGVATVNGTAALHLALRTLGVRPGDEVLVPALTFVASGNAIHHAGAVPHFVDSEAANLGLDPEALSRHLASIATHRDGQVINRQTGARIAAIMPVHVFGHAVDMDPLMALAARYDLPVLEDATEALGSHYHDRPCGGLGHMAALSFNGNKILTTGGGGALVTQDAELARRAKHLSTTAKLPHAWAFDHDEIAFNYRLPNINAALGCAQLAQLDDRLARKRALFQRYVDAFEGFEGATIFTEPNGCRSNLWLNALLLNPEQSSQRDGLLDALNRAGIMCRPVWRLLHRLPFNADCPRADLSVAEVLEQRIINLPSSASLGAT